MKYASKLSLFVPLTITSLTAFAEMEIDDVFYPHADQISDPRLQLTLFPGVARATATSLVMQMQDTSFNKVDILNLNTSLVNQIESNKSNLDLQEIKVPSNNILELRF